MSAATRLRRLDEHAQITVLERSGHVSFANCGLPYHVGGVITDREALLLQTPASLRDRFGLDVLVLHEAVRIDRERRVVVSRDLTTGTEHEHAYDALVLSPGARPVTPAIRSAQPRASARHPGPPCRPQASPTPVHGAQPSSTSSSTALSTGCGPDGLTGLPRAA